MATLIKGTDVNVYGQCSCLICGEGIPLSSPLDKGYKVCDNCKEAVMYVREHFCGDWVVNSDPDKGPC